MINKKTVKAKIYDPDNGNFLSDISVEIEMVTPSNPDEKPHYEVNGKIDKICVEFSDKNLIIELNPSLRGFALFSIKNIAGWFTEYHIFLQDSVWNNLEWFTSL